jgi:hypothetical protein
MSQRWRQYHDSCWKFSNVSLVVFFPTVEVFTENLNLRMYSDMLLIKVISNIHDCIFISCYIIPPVVEPWNWVCGAECRAVLRGVRVCSYIRGVCVCVCVCVCACVRQRVRQMCNRVGGASAVQWCKECFLWWACDQKSVCCFHKICFLKWMFRKLTCLVRELHCESFAGVMKTEERVLLGASSRAEACRLISESWQNTS